MTTQQPARYRKSASNPSPKPSEKAVPRDSPSASTDSAVGISFLDVVRLLLGIFLLSSTLSYFITGDSILWGWRPWWVRPEVLKQKFTGPITLTDAELSKYDGTDPNLPIYVGLDGSIYDVSAAPQTYGPSGGYHFFAGRDAARAFLTGCFQDDQTPDLRGVEEMYLPLDDPTEDAKLSSGELKKRRERDMRIAKKRVRETIDHWAGVFRGDTGRPYFHVGRIVRPEGWPENEPRKELCEQARQGRPTRENFEAQLKYPA